jgi:hypothetical protein
MTAGNQQVAPMSRFLNSGACTGAVNRPAQSDALVVGLDGISLVGSRTTTASAACNGDANTACDDTFEPNTGAAYNATVNGYIFNGWRDVLRVLLAGFDHSSVASGTNAAAWAARDCNSAIRQAVANNYGNFFENKCAAAAGETTTTVCTQIRHVFRRDDFSGTTDTMVGLLNLPAIVQPSSAQPTGATPFCNAVRPAFVFPDPKPTCLVPPDATWDPTILPTATNLGACTRETGVYRSTMQDNDPIRRTCAANEQVCSHSKDLGLVLTMNDVPEPAPRSNADRYNATACSFGTFTSATPPEIFDAITQRQQICANLVTGAKIKLCPNGDVCTPTGGCNVPAIAASAAGPINPQCLASVLQAPGAPASLTGVPLIHPAGPGVAEGRAFNQHLYVLQGTAGAYQTNGFTPGLPVTGAYYRIHTTRSLNPVTNRTCQFDDMTTQIGCLAEASPCSIGYAGRGALGPNPNVDAIKLNKQSPVDFCIQSHFLYPLSRKLYLSTLVGFGNVETQELQLVGCETDLDQPNAALGATPGGLVTSNIVAAGFLPIPTFVNNGKPFCEDFNESALCGAPLNNDACLDPTPNLDAFPEFSTICGDGQVDSFEDCDNGTLNGTLGNSCSTTCRNLN